MLRDSDYLHQVTQSGTVKQLRTPGLLHNTLGLAQPFVRTRNKSTTMAIE